MGTWSESRRSLRIVSMHAARYTVTMSLFNDILSAFGVLALQGLKMTVLGLAIGTVLLVPLMVLISNVLRGFSFEAVSPMTLVPVVLVLFAVSAVASVVPATRAVTVDPVSVLQAD